MASATPSDSLAYIERSQRIDDVQVLVTCQSGTSLMLSSEVNGSIAHERDL